MLEKKYALQLLDKVSQDPLDLIMEEHIGTVNCLNGHSLTVAMENEAFFEALTESDLLLCDGILIQFLCRLMLGKKVKRVTGPKFADLYIRHAKQKILFLGSSEIVCKKLLIFMKGKTLSKCDAYSPSFTNVVTDNFVQENLNAVKSADPSSVFLGLTAPKQEILAHRMKPFVSNINFLQVGAYFEFAAGTLQRAPKFLSWLGLEWLWRLILQPTKIGKRIINLRKLLFILL